MAWVECTSCFEKQKFSRSTRRAHERRSTLWQFCRIDEDGFICSSLFRKWEGKAYFFVFKEMDARSVSSHSFTHTKNEWMTFVFLMIMLTYFGTACENRERERKSTQRSIGKRRGKTRRWRHRHRTFFFSFVLCFDSTQIIYRWDDHLLLLVRSYCWSADHVWKNRQNEKKKEKRMWRPNRGSNPGHCG